MNAPCGAYGYRVDPRQFDPADLHPAPSHWPSLRTAFTGPVPAGWPMVIDGPGWAVHVEPGGSAVHYVGSAHGAWDDPDTRLHPLLSLLCLAATLARRGDSLHASGVLTTDGVVGVLAPTGGGKTTTVAWLALHAGVQAFTDDNLTVRDGEAHAGPRSLDLRPAAATGLGVEHRAREVRQSQRRRLRLPPPDRVTAPVVRLVFLEWGEKVSVRSVPVRERMAALATQRTAQPYPGGLTVPLDLAAVPMVVVTRPRTFAGMPDVAAAVLGR
jgi:hypothetical protein